MLLDGLPRGHFRCIAADPPWRYLTWSKKGMGRSPERHYRTMTIDEIKALPVADVAAKDCVLLIWCVNPMLDVGIEVMRAWGFQFKTVGFCWAKMTPRSAPWMPKYHFGMGHWSRANVEVCLLGTRGKPQRQSKSVRQLIVAPVREHSRKPDEFLPSVEQLVPGPYLEMFSRSNRPGWTTVGDEVGKFDEVAA